MSREVKVMPQAIKSITDRTVTGICAVFGNVDFGGDRILPGAFKKTLQERAGQVVHTWFHGIEGWERFATPPTAKIVAIREVGRDELGDAVLQKAPAAMGGLEITRAYLNTDRGNEVLEALKAEVPLQMSFGYDVIKVGYPEGIEQLSVDHWRDLLEVKLYETTDCIFGMNDATVGSKAMDLTEQMEVLATRFAALMKKLRRGMSERERAELSKLKALILEADNLVSKELTENSRAEARSNALVVSLTDISEELTHLESFLEG